MKTRQHTINNRFFGLKPSSTLAINEKSKQLVSQGKEVTRLGLGQSPFPVPQTVVAALQQHAHEKDYLAVSGLPELRTSIAGHLSRSRNKDYSMDQVFVGPGTKELLFLFQIIYDGVLVLPAPSWVSYAPQAQLAGTPTAWVSTDIDHGWRIQPDELEKVCQQNANQRLVMILNYPNNPAGTTYNAEQLQAIAEVARKYQMIIIADEIYWELTFDDHPASIISYYPEGTIISTGLSKWCGAGGWRLGAFAFPEELFWIRDALAIIASESFSAVAAPIQYAAITAFDGNEEITRYLKNCRKVLKAILDHAVITLKKGGIQAVGAEGGFYILADFNEKVDTFLKSGIHNSAQLSTTMLEDIGIAALPGTDFGLQPQNLVLRLAMVDFDGKAVLDAMAEDIEIDQHFLKSHLPKVFHAPQKMVDWLHQM